MQHYAAVPFLKFRSENLQPSTLFAKLRKCPCQPRQGKRSIFKRFILTISNCVIVQASCSQTLLTRKLSWSVTESYRLISYGTSFVRLWYPPMILLLVAAPATYVCHTIPRHILEQTYGIHIIAPAEDEVARLPFPLVWSMLGPRSSTNCFRVPKCLQFCSRPHECFRPPWYSKRLAYCSQRLCKSNHLLLERYCHSLGQIVILQTSTRIWTVDVKGCVRGLRA